MAEQGLGWGDKKMTRFIKRYKIQEMWRAIIADFPKGHGTQQYIKMISLFIVKVL